MWGDERVIDVEGDDRHGVDALLTHMLWVVHTATLSIIHVLRAQSVTPLL